MAKPASYRPIPIKALRELYEIINSNATNISATNLKSGSPLPKRGQIDTGIYCNSPAGFLKHLRLKQLPCPACYWMWDDYTLKDEYDLTTQERFPVDIIGVVTETRKIKKPPTLDEKCGTTSGYARHARDKEQACEACNDANKAANRKNAAKRRARQREAS